MLLGLLQPPSASAGQLNSRPGHGLPLGNHLSLPAGEKIEDGPVVGEHMAARRKDEQIEEMEDRLAQMMREIRQMEEKVAEVAKKLVP